MVNKINKSNKLKNLGGRGKSFVLRNKIIVALRDNKISYGIIGEIVGKNKKTVREIYDRDHNKLKGKIKILINAD